MKKITIYDLAELSGVSASAVSAILNGNWKKRRISAKLAEKVTRIAEEQGYAINRQASMLRSKKSHVIGMIIPKYDNRYFGSIAERFEEMARERGLLPIITCTRRRPELEIEAVKAMLSWQVDWVVATGATNPDKISALCQQAGVPTVNLDLPGSLSPSVISDNYGGAKALTHKILANSARRRGELAPLTFIGGEQPPMGCFDWDPFVYLLGHDIDMVQQDVPAMLDAVFSIIDAGEASQQRIEIPPRLMSSS